MSDQPTEKHERICIKCYKHLTLTEPMLGEGWCRDCAPPLDPSDTQMCEDILALTDAEVDAFLKEHENDPVDEARADRIEWMFREKLAADALAAGREWLHSYDEQHANESKRTAATLGQLYGGTKSMIANMVRVIETLALKPASAPAHQPSAVQAPEHLWLPDGFTPNNHYWWTYVHIDAYEAQAVRIAELEAMLKHGAEDWAETDTAIRELCRPYTDVDGDSFAVPTLEDVVGAALKPKSETVKPKEGK